MPAYPPYANSAQANVLQQPSRGNKSLDGVEVPWPLLQTFGSAAVNLQADTPSILGTVAQTDLTRVGWVDAAAYTDETTDAASAGAADVTLLPATEEDEVDYLLTGHVNPFFGLEVITSTAGVGGTVAWEYYASNGTWKTLPNIRDLSSGFTATAGTYVVHWHMPEDWAGATSAELSLTGITELRRLYWVRARVTQVYSTNPVGSRVRCYPMDASAVTLSPIAPCKGVVEKLYWWATTASATNADTILEFVNHTRKTRGLVTMTKNLVSGVATFSKPFRIEPGDEVTVHGVQEDGTTEYQTVRLMLGVSI